MDEEESRETEAEETQEEENGGDEAATEEVEQEQEAEEHDWGALEARLDALESRIEEMAEALATISIGEEQPEGELETEEFGEDGEALDLPELEQMLGL